MHRLGARMMPGEDGLAIARKLRENWQCGLVIVTGRGDAVDKIVGLEVGVDDYVTKPFDLRELLARVTAVLRRTVPIAPALAGTHVDPKTRPERLHFDGWTLGAAARCLVDPAGAEVALTTLIGIFLAGIGCEVTAKSNAEDALDALVPGARFDLLVTDIALGAGMRGTQLAADAQRRLPGLSVLLMSGFSSELLDADRDSPSDWELLRKPCSRGELTSAVAKAIGERPRD